MTLRSATWVVCVFFAGLAMVSSAIAESSAMNVPFAESFDQPALDAAWQVDVSRGNSIEIRDGALSIRARQNTYAHIERPLGVDFVRVTAAVRPSSAVTWCTSVFLYWDRGNWCQIGMVDRQGGQFHVLEMIDQQAHEYFLAPCTLDRWHHVGIELAADCIRYLGGDNAESLTTVLMQRRTEPYARAPALLIVGKGHGGPAGYPAPDLDNDYREPGEVGVSLVKEIAVTAVPWERLRATAAERKVWEDRGKDLPGEQELAAVSDPTFESVSRHFPPMKLPREIVGVKDHPHDIGVAWDGQLQLNDDCNDPKLPRTLFEIGEPAYRFGSGQTPCKKRLHNGFMPIIIAEDEHDGLTLRQTILGWSEGFSADTPLFAFVRMQIANATGTVRNVPVRFVVEPAEIGVKPLEWRLDVPAHGEQSVDLMIPFDIGANPATEVPAAQFDETLAAVTTYWQELIGPGTRFELPEQRIQDAYRAWLAYNFLNVDKRDGVYHVCDGAGFYEVVYGYSAALYSHALDLAGWHEQSRIYLDSLMTFQQDDGLLCVNFGSTDTGTLLYVLSEHYRLTRDADWLRSVAPKILAAANWITEHRRESMKHFHSKRAVVHGLVRYQPYCDHELPAFDYFSNGYMCMGMARAAEALADVGMVEDADRLRKESQAYRQDILASMDASVFTRDGIKMLPIMPDTHTLLKETGYTANGYYGLLAACVLETTIPAHDDPRADWLVDMLRQRGGLQVGVCQFFDMIDHAYAYGYWETCLKRDEVKPVILGLYGSLAYGMSRDTYAAVECTRVRSGENYWTLPHTYSNTQQFRMLRYMLLREDDAELHIGQAIPRHWLADGKRVAIREAPTTFGPVTCTIESHTDTGTIDVRLDPPARQPVGRIHLRLRHPAGLAIKAVESTPEARFKFADDTIVLTNPDRPLDLLVRY